jgi:hypothetical protein
MTQKQSSPTPIHTGIGLPICLSPRNCTRISGELQDLHQNTRRLNHSSTAPMHGPMLDAACHAGEVSLTEMQAGGKKQMPQFALKNAEQFCLHVWQALVFFVFTRLYVRVNRTPYAAIDPEALVARKGRAMTYRILDLFCGAGGCSRGYADAGFEVVGADINPQPRYPYTFIQADAMELLQDRVFLAQFDAIHASPPCQGYSRSRHIRMNWIGQQLLAILAMESEAIA